MSRLRAALAALALIAVALIGCGQPAATASPTSAGMVTARPIPQPASTTAGTALSIPEIDLHDGMVAEFSGTYYLYGSEYSCGFQWYVASPWCGFGVSTAPSLSGPWTTPTLLFPPTETDPTTGATFASECATTDGHGCFNARMAQRGDGVFVLWFNEVNGRTSTTTHAYWVMGCNGPAGPCGASAGAPYGSTHKPTLHQCNGDNGDFALVGDGTGGEVLICSYGGSLSEEHLDTWWANGNAQGSTALAGAAGIEGEGAFEAADGTWVMTYAEACGYCTGTPTGYMTAPSIMGPWTAPVNAGWSAPPGGRRDFQPNSCGGQARTVSVVDGQPYEVVDLWVAQRNETAAGLLLAPLTYNPTATGAAGAPGDGQVWVPPVSYPC